MYFFILSAAFQEVFNLFDSNGGGTIDADELQLVLGSVDIHLPAKDIRDVLEGIDKDGLTFLDLFKATSSFCYYQIVSRDRHRPIFILLCTHLLIY